MFSFARNERGIRLASAAIILFPIVCLICAMSHSGAAQAAVLSGYAIFAVIALAGFLLERSEECRTR